MKTVTAFVSSALVVLGATVSLLAHQETHKGTVLSVEATGVRVDVVDPKTKKTSARRFEVDNETKILRDDVVVTFAAARIRKGETIAVTVDHDLDEDLALVVRLGTTK